MPGFVVRQLPLDLANINSVKYRPDGKLYALGYNGNIHLLSDTNGDGLEDKAEPFWDRGGLRGPIGMALTPPGYARGNGLFVPSKGKLSLIVDLSQVAAPRVIGELIQVGMVRQQTRWMLDILEDPERTGVVVVTTPEEMPVVETIELLDRFAADTQIEPAAIVANRVLPALFDRKESAVVASLGAVEQLLVDAVGPGVSDVVLAAQLTEARRAVGSRHLERLRAAVPAGLPILYVPELFTRATGRRVVALVADALGEELDVA